jgi:hypothetical protein
MGFKLLLTTHSDRLNRLVRACVRFFFMETFEPDEAVLPWPGLTIIFAAALNPDDYMNSASLNGCGLYKTNITFAQ